MTIILLNKFGRFKRVCRKSFLLGALLFFLSASAFASPKSDFYIQQALDRYFTLPQDARALSLAGFGLNCQDSACIFLNPAGLSSVTSPELGLSAGASERGGKDILTEESIEQSENQGYGIISFPLGPRQENKSKYGTIAAAYSRYEGETNDTVNSTPDGHRRTIGYGFAPMKSFSLGYSLTFYDDQLRSDFADLHSQARFLHFFGIQVAPRDDIKLGATFKLGDGNSDTEDFFRQPDGLSHVEQYSSDFGLTKEFDDFTFSTSAGYSHYSSKGNLNDTSQGVVIGGDEGGESYNVRVAGQISPWENLFLRTGVAYEYTHYRFNRADLEALSGDLQGPRLSAGVGYLFGPTLGASNIRLDSGLSYATVGDGTWRYLVTLGILL